MNLNEIKAIIVDGLGGTVLSDPTLIAFINAGSRMADRLSDFPHGQGKLSFTINLNDYFLVFPTRIRMVHGVWIKETTSEAEPPRLEKRDLITLRGLYPNPTATDKYGKPTDYAHTTSILASYGSPTIDEMAMPMDDIPVAVDDPYDYKGLIFGPTADATYYIDVLGTAYSAELRSGEDSNFWSKHHPLVLVNAALYKIEGLLRNASSAQNFLAVVQQEITGINFDSIEDELQDKPNYIGAAGEVS